MYNFFVRMKYISLIQMLDTAYTFNLYFRNCIFRIRALILLLIKYLTARVFQGFSIIQRYEVAGTDQQVFV